MINIYNRFSDKENSESTGDGFRRELKEESYGKIGYGIGIFEVIVIVLGIFLLYPIYIQFIFNK
ncbi:hypothetical protein [Clostridium sp. BJN0013]|uniref:hypothetical protein n=1 Tax=Clostridium sp. BJN0013 TaxID=3236840 RepID=UPI0034C5F3F3